MISRPLRLVVLLAGSIAVSAPLGAQQQDPPAISLTLEEAIARAVTASNRVAEARARGDAAGAAVETRHAAMLPQVSAQAGYMRTNHVRPFVIPSPTGALVNIYPDIPDNYRTRLDVQWPLYTGRRLGALEEAAREESSAAANDVETMVNDVRLDTARAFWGLVVAGETLRVVNESLNRMTAHVRDVGNQLDAGLVPPNELMTARAQEARQRMLSIQARSSREVTESDLARLIGVAPGTRLEPVSPLELPPIGAAPDALLREALDRRPDRKALADRVEAAALRAQAAGAGRKPTVAVAGGYDYAKPNTRIFPRAGVWQDSWDAAVNVNWPLFDGGRTKSEVAEASAAVRAAQARLTEFDSLVALEIRQRLSEIEASRAAADAADVSIQAATEARRVVGDRFAAGVATSTDVVDAQVAILQAQLDRTQAIATARLAEARLNRALGR